MQAINWIRSTYNAYSRSINIAAGAASVGVIALVAYRYFQSPETQKRGEQVLADGVKQESKYSYRVSDQIWVTSNFPDVAKAAANAIAQVRLIPLNFVNTNIYVLKSRLPFRVFTDDGFFAAEAETPLQGEGKRTIVLFLPRKSPQEEETFENGEKAWGMVEHTEDAKLVGLGKENVLFGSNKDLLALMQEGKVPAALVEHPLFAEDEQRSL